MTSWSSTKRLINEMSNLESSSCKKIPSTSYYMVRLKFEGEPVDTSDFANVALCSKPQPVAVYFADMELDFIFSCSLDGEEHQLDGNHHRIISKYVSIALKNFPKTTVEGQIVEFETQMHVITYIGLMIFNTSQKLMKRLSGGKITDDLLYFRTEKELADILAEDKVDWNRISSADKYGTFAKLREKKGKVLIAEMTRQFDARETKHYIDFIFT